jgi:hypothetical protein
MPTKTKQNHQPKEKAGRALPGKDWLNPEVLLPPPLHLHRSS